ncbi:hypothetical protein CXG81DRAFT_10760, partial [Caulochytrium protostelioides]
SDFVIVGTHDGPLYEVELGPGSMAPLAGGDPPYGHLAQFIAYAALDSVADARWLTPQAYLKVIDKFNEWLVSAYIGADGARLVLLHENLHSDGIRSFFHDVQEALVKVILNPFHDVNAPILSTAFDQRVRAAARKYL